MILRIASTSHSSHTARKHRLRAASLLLAIVALTALVPTASASALTGSTRLHDPSVIKVGSCYYGFSTGFENDPLNPSGSITEYKTCDATAATGWVKVGNIWNSTPRGS